MIVKEHAEQVAHWFRHEYGKLVALLSRRFGIQHLDLIEDAVQWSLAQALETWPATRQPDNPSAWLYRVASRHLITEFRSRSRKETLLSQHVFDDDVSTVDTELPEHTLSNEINDAMLRLLFVTCHDNMPVESQLVFTLKSLCGFSIKEIAQRLFISEANAYKRFSRAKEHLKSQNLTFENITQTKMAMRLNAVHKILYLIFTEGYLSSHEDMAIRQDLCDEAIRLTTLLQNNALSDPTTCALLALMYLHRARLASRKNNSGTLVLLAQQDRTVWDSVLIAQGITLLEKSSGGDNISRYHIEASIAAEHCLSPSFDKTRWKNIISSYELLEQVAPSPIHKLNKAIALAEWKGPQVALSELTQAKLPLWLERSYHWYAVLADLYFRCNNNKAGRFNADSAIRNAPTQHIKKLLKQRFANYIQ